MDKSRIQMSPNSNIRVPVSSVRQKKNARRIRYTFARECSSLLTLWSASTRGWYSHTCDTSGHTLVSENISFNVPYVRHVPSIDRGRCLARVYKPSLSSIKRVLSCNLAITRTCHALATHHQPTVRCVWVRLRARAHVYVCASHSGCVSRASRRASSWPLWASPPARLATDFTRIGRTVK